jgi:hypothetical protein
MRGISTRFSKYKKEMKLKIKWESEHKEHFVGLIDGKLYHCPGTSTKEKKNGNPCPAKAVISGEFTVSWIMDHW